MKRGELRKLAEALADARVRAAEADDTVLLLRADWEAQHKVELEVQQVRREAVERAEKQLREEAVWTAVETRDLRPGPGIVVKRFTVPKYTDEAALAWAKETGLALKLDTAAFVKIAKVTPIAFVTLEEELRATIATDLPAALAKRDEPEPF